MVGRQTALHTITHAQVDAHVFRGKVEGEVAMLLILL